MQLNMICGQVKQVSTMRECTMRECTMMICIAHVLMHVLMYPLADMKTPNRNLSYMLMQQGAGIECTDSIISMTCTQ